MSTTGKKGRFSVKILLRLFCLTGILFLSGCHLEKEPVAAPKEGRYLVYYLNGSGHADFPWRGTGERGASGKGCLADGKSCLAGS